MDDNGHQWISAQFPRSQVWDGETQKLVDSVRSVIHSKPPPTILQLQNYSLRSRPLGNEFCVTYQKLPVPPQDEAKRALFRAIQALGKIEHEDAPVAEVGLEWVSMRENYSSQSAEAAKVDPHSVETKITVLHIHGGGMFQGSASSYRATTSRLAALTRGRVISIDYRLCPQHTFPAALLDVFIAYLSLLYPPPGSTHSPLDPSTIVLAGDSSGAVLALSLLQVLRATSSYGSMAFHSRQVAFPISMPAGIAALSVSGDTVQGAPSYESNRVNDLFLHIPWAYPDYPRCELWPSSPPRADMLCADIANFTHPLLSPSLAPSWEGCPPMWFGGGQEQFYDGAKAIARRAARQGVSVTWLEFEAMPHCFPTLPGLSRMKQSTMLMERWAAFCTRCVQKPTRLPTSPTASRIQFADLAELKIPLETLDDPSFAEMELRIKTHLATIQREFERDWLVKGAAKANL